jgi:hypothetical protein
MHHPFEGKKQTKREREIITTLAKMGRLRRRCHGSRTDCFPEASVLHPHMKKKDLHLDLHAGGRSSRLIPEATVTRACRPVERDRATVDRSATASGNRRQVTHTCPASASAVTPRL